MNQHFPVRLPETPGSTDFFPASILRGLVQDVASGGIDYAVVRILGPTLEQVLELMKQGADVNQIWDPRHASQWRGSATLMGTPEVFGETSAEMLAVARFLGVDAMDVAVREFHKALGPSIDEAAAELARHQAKHN